MERAPHTYNSGRIRRAGGDFHAPKRSVQPVQVEKPKPKKKKRHALAIVGISLLAVVAVAFALGNRFLGLLNNTVLDTKGTGSVHSDNYTPKKYKGDVINILVVGIDHEEGRTAALTDVILYLNYDLVNNKLNIMQIPRDSYIGSGMKINELMSSGEDTKNPINNLANYISQKFMLPVDRYVAIDMDGFKDLVNAMHNIYVYVPQDMEYQGSKLTQGYHWLDGEAAEFFVRNRNFVRGDNDRLENQRYFYAAVFKRLLELTPGDVVKLMPTFAYHCATDFSTTDLMDLATTALSLSPENVMFVKAPGATASNDERFPDSTIGKSFYYIDLHGRAEGENGEPALGLANILNTYFRTYDDRGSIPASELGLPQINIPPDVALYPNEIKTMGDVQNTIPEDTTGGAGEA